MISRDYVTAWRTHAPWVQDVHVEQDLVISRALVAIFSHKLLHEALAFRGGTALYKLHLRPAALFGRHRSCANESRSRRPDDGRAPRGPRSLAWQTAIQT